MTTNWNFQGAHFDRSAVGPDACVDNRHSSGATVTQLTGELAALRARLQTAPDSADRQVALRELDAFVVEIAEPEPDRAAVRARWERLRSRAAAALPVGADLAQITSLVLQVFGG